MFYGGQSFTGSIPSVMANVVFCFLVFFVVHVCVWLNLKKQESKQKNILTM